MNCLIFPCVGTWLLQLKPGLSGNLEYGSLDFKKQQLILTKKLTIISTSISTMGIIYTKLGCYYVYTISFRAVNSLNFWPWVTNWFQFEIFDTWIWKMYFYVNTIHNGICLHLLENGYILLIVSCCNWHHNKY